MSVKYKLVLLFLAFLLILSCKKEESLQQPFNEFNWGANVNSRILCAGAPLITKDTQAIVFLNCDVEGENYTLAPYEAKDELTVFSYNIEEGHSGNEIIKLLQSEIELKVPDIILLSEVNKGRKENMNGENFARVLADSLNMYYVFGVEFFDVDANCEMGNAILSKYPMGNVTYKRYSDPELYYLYTESGYNYRQGGRSFIAADIKIGQKFARVYSTHLAASFFDNELRYKETQELIEDAKQNSYGRPTIIGGDFNSYIYSAYLTENFAEMGIGQYFMDGGYTDTHLGVPYADRYTNFDYVDWIIDLIFIKNATSSSPSVGKSPAWEGLSDHYPIWTTVKI
jgi:endonuclease/exonuclease/phosphatase family metal-dependent hydrolase